MKKAKIKSKIHCFNKRKFPSKNYKERKSKKLKIEIILLTFCILFINLVKKIYKKSLIFLIIL